MLGNSVSARVKNTAIDEISSVHFIFTLQGFVYVVKHGSFLILSREFNHLDQRY